LGRSGADSEPGADRPDGTFADSRRSYVAGGGEPYLTSMSLMAPARTLQIISAAEAAGHARVAEMNRQVAGNLDKIIASLEDGGQGKEAAAGAS
jgi:hypothetical protein